MNKQASRFCFIVSLIIGAAIVLSGCTKKQSSGLVINFQSATATLDATFKDFAEVRDDPVNAKKHQEILQRMEMFLISAGEKNPDYLQNLLTKIIKATADAGPSMALQLQDYADKELKLEMERLNKSMESEMEVLKKSSGVLALAEKEKEKQIADLGQEINALKQQLAGKEKELNELRAKILPPPEGVPVIIINN